MPTAVSSSEYARLSALFRLGVLDAPAEPEFEHLLADLAAAADAPMAQLVFADLHRLVPKATVGLTWQEQSRAGSLPDTLIDDRTVLDIPDWLESGGERHGALDGAPDLRAFLGIRVQTFDEHAVGAVFVADRRPRAFGDDIHRYLGATRDRIAAWLESRRRSRLDPATGALASGPFLEQAAAVIGAARAGGQPVSLLVIDLAKTCRQLDSVGSGLGRLALQRVGELGREQVRQRDSLGRLDESCFAVLLSDTDEAGARILEQRLAAYLLRGWEALMPVVTLEPLAIGVATWRSGDAEDPRSLVAAARSGRTSARSSQRASLVA